MQIIFKKIQPKFNRLCKKDCDELQIRGKKSKQRTSRNRKKASSTQRKLSLKAIVLKFFVISIPDFPDICLCIQHQTSSLSLCVELNVESRREMDSK
ncbi:hypothetical protein CEXT_182761 [Caerostris extrusa]|uniref:Uncharacterized protein n=1 Tax=Caerostris extrusa TaxID=172846 RepID=A0AAV4SR70_CAEEX|nr:hypothetical protein CEXT_182761 [Caerostris extrusa]